MLLSKRKRYLSGPDWVINTLDRMMKVSTCAGNVSQLVLLLDAPLAEETVRTELNRFIKRFPVLEGRVARDWLLTPYWKIPAATVHDVALTVSHHTGILSAETLLPALVQHVNEPFRADSDHLAFHFFAGSERSALAMRFDHRLFDARGAESFLQLFQQTLNAASPGGDIAFTSSPALTQWQQKFLAGRNVNRRFIALAKSTPHALTPPPGREKGFKYRLLTFSREETAAIYDRAYREAGYLMESPFILAAILLPVHELFSARSGTGSSYLIPVTTDLRPGQDPLQEMFFNHVSYLFYQIPVQQGADMKGLVTAFKQQMYNQVKAGFPRDLAEASLLTRIAPLCVLGKLLHAPLKGKMATFVFSHLGKSSYQSADCMGGRVENIFHMPRVPVPPGLGFFSNYFNDRLNLVISYLDGLLSDEEVRLLEAGIRVSFGVAPA